MCIDTCEMDPRLLLLLVGSFSVCIAAEYTRTVSYLDEVLIKWYMVSHKALHYDHDS